MKKLITAAVIILSLAFVVGSANHASAVSDTAVSPEVQKKCQASLDSFSIFVKVMQQYQKNYYAPVGDEDLAKYYPVKSTVFLDGTRHDVNSSYGKVPFYNEKGHLVMGARVNYSLVVRRHNGTIESLKAAGNGIEATPSYTNFVASNVKLDLKVKAASAQIDELVAQWNSTAAGPAQFKIDCKTQAGVDEVTKDKALRTADFAKMKQSLNLVKLTSDTTSRDFNKLSVDYKKLTKDNKKAKATETGKGAGGVKAP